MANVRRIISETDNKVTILVHGDAGATGLTFVDPREFSNPRTTGGATGFLPYYVWYLESLNWTMNSTTNVHMDWQSTSPEELMSVSGTGDLFLTRDHQSRLSAVNPGATGFTGRLLGTITGSSVSGWTLLLTIRKTGDYFPKTTYDEAV